MEIEDQPDLCLCVYCHRTFWSNAYAAEPDECAECFENNHMYDECIKERENEDDE